MSSQVKNAQMLAETLSLKNTIFFIHTVHKFV